MLTFGFNCLQILRISICETLVNTKEEGFLSGMKLSNLILEDPISFANFGPTPAKNVLNPLEISKYSEIT